MAKRNIERPYNSGTLSEAEFFGKIRSALRNVFRYWKVMQLVLKNASRPSEDKTNKRLKTQYQCNHCKKWFKRSDVHIDHIVPAGSLKSYDDIVPFIKNLTSDDIDNYQILCKKKCHLEKSKQEKQNRKNE